MKILSFLQSLFTPVYEKVEYSQDWGIKRRWLFFSKHLTHDKIVKLSGGYCAVSYERLLFSTEIGAENEIDRLNLGYGRIRSRVYKNGKLLEEHYEKE
jgi:hypothetical protein